MATNTPGGSHLAQLAAKRKKLDAARAQLQIGPSGGVSDARAQSNVQAPAPTPQAPAAPPESASSQTTTAAGGTSPQRDQMRQQADEFLARAKSSQTSSGGANGEIAPAPPTLGMAPPSTPAPLSAQIAAVGGQQLSPMAQFMRVAGRPPSGRELYVFNAVRSLEERLGRPPTRNEVLLHVTAPGAATEGPGPVA